MIYKHMNHEINSNDQSVGVEYNGANRSIQVQSSWLCLVIKEVFSGHSRSQDFFEIKDLLDVVHLFFPRLSSAGVSVLPSHGAPSPAQVRPTAGGGCGGDGEKRRALLILVLSLKGR